MKRVVAIGNVLYLYMIVLVIFMIFRSNKNVFFEYMMHDVFHDSLIFILIPVFFSVIQGVLSIVFVILSAAGKVKLDGIPRTNMIMRMLQLPAYVMMFVYGLLCLITIFTFGISIGIIVLEFLGLITSGLYAISTFIYMKREGKITAKGQVLLSIFSFFYLSDYIASIVAFVKNSESESKRKPILISLVLSVVMILAGLELFHMMIRG